MRQQKGRKTRIAGALAACLIGPTTTTAHEPASLAECRSLAMEEMGAAAAFTEATGRHEHDLESLTPREVRQWMVDVAVASVAAGKAMGRHEERCSVLGLSVPPHTPRGMAPMIEPIDTAGEG